MEHPNDITRGRSLAPVTWVLLALLLVAGAVAFAIQWSQNSARLHAMKELRMLRVELTIQGGVGGSPSRHKFRATRPAMSDADVEALINHVATLAQPYDLGLSEGETIELIDLTETTASPAAVEKLRQAFPNTEVRD